MVCLADLRFRILPHGREHRTTRVLPAGSSLMCDSCSAFRLRRRRGRRSGGAPGGSRRRGGRAAEPGGGGAGGRPRRSRRGPAVDVRATTVQRMSVQRKVDLAGNLLSPDQAKVSAEAGGVVRQVLVEIGTEVKVGQPLVRLDPRELELALARAESALRQTYAQLGMHEDRRRRRRRRRPTSRWPRSGRRLANLDDARATDDRAAGAGRAAASCPPVDLQTARDPAEGGRGRLPVRASTRCAASRRSCRTGGRPTSWRRRSWTTPSCGRQSPGGVVDRFVQVGEYISERTVVATIVQMNPLKLRTGVQETHAGIIDAGPAASSSAWSRSATRCSTGRWPT